jgi:hypothetical protein
LVIATLLMASCGGGSSTAQFSSNAGSVSGALVPPPVVSGNTTPIVVDAGPVAGQAQINVAYVTVTVCAPGTTVGAAACQTIDHVALDTGSSGLRLLKTSLFSNLNLTPVASGPGVVGECLPFVIGTIWGSVRYADIYVGGEVARNVPIQDIGDQPGGATSIPSDCLNYGAIQDTQALLGANGVLGVGLFANDCDACLTTPLPGAYYTCTSSGCTNSTVSATQVVRNPVADFSQDNNGVLIELNAVPAGETNALSGTLVFGIGTQSNNAIGSATVYPVDPTGNFSTMFNGNTVTSFIDSGTNAFFFTDPGIPSCSGITWAYCPPSTTNLAATNSAATPTGTPSGLVDFSIINADHLAATAVAANIGGPYPSGSGFDWGLPFFFNRPVFTAMANAGTGTGPYFAY